MPVAQPSANGPNSQFPASEGLLLAHKGHSQRSSRCGLMAAFGPFA